VRTLGGSGLRRRRVRAFQRRDNDVTVYLVVLLPEASLMLPGIDVYHFVAAFHGRFLIVHNDSLKAHASLP
jgi:hypothetical protein